MSVHSVIAPLAQYVVTINEPEGVPWAEVFGAITALAAVVAIGITLHTARRSREAAEQMAKYARDAADEAARIAERRALAMRIGAWMATVEEATDRFVFLNHDARLADITAKDLDWDAAHASIDRERRRLHLECAVLLGSDERVSGAVHDLSFAVKSARHGWDAWRSAEFVRVHEAREANSHWTELDMAVDKLFGDEGRELRKKHIHPHRMPVVTAAISLSNALGAVAKAGWQPEPEKATVADESADGNRRSSRPSASSV